jgi:Tfp pilus assembly protein PilF
LFTEGDFSLMFNRNKSIAMLKTFRASRLIPAAVLILSIAVAAHAQAPGSSRGLAAGDGIHAIQGRVVLPSGQSTSKLMKVELESTNMAGGASTATDQDGAFRFQSLRAGRYTVVVDGGKEFETARETINIDPAGTGGRVVQVAVLLRYKVDASNPAFAGVPKEALDSYQKGTAAAQKGNVKGAVEFLSKAVTAYPNFPQALSELGVQYLKLGEMEKAAETYEALLKLKPNDASAHLDLAIALYNQSSGLISDKKLDEAQKKLEGAETHLREALKLKSPGPTAHYYLGLTMIRFKQFAEAQKEMELAIANGGEGLAQAHRYLGGLYQSAHRNKEAADELEKYLKLDPKAKDAETIRGIIEKLRKQ